MTLVPSTTIAGPRGTTLTPVRIAAGQVAAVLHAPASGEPTAAGVMFPPAFYENQLCHRTLRSLAERLASTGAAVLRLDYRGTGDSPGDPEQFGPTSWLEDAESGAEFLQRYVGRRPTFVFGLRLGGVVALAAAAAEDTESQPDIYVWAPTLSGAAHAAELDAAHRGWFARYADHHGSRRDGSSATDRVLGQPWPAKARRALESFSAPAPASLEGRVVLIETEGEELSAGERADLAAAAPMLEVSKVEGPAPWRQDPDAVSPGVPARALEGVVRVIAADLG